MATELGEKEQVCGWTLIGCPPPPELTLIMIEMIERVGMTPHGAPDVRCFPTLWGKGGHGAQIYMPLTESWNMGGTWEEHNRTRIVLSSCEPYDPKAVEKWLIGSIGPVIKKGTFNL